MTPQQIVGLSVRLFSIWLFIYAFQVNGFMIALGTEPEANEVFIRYVIVGLVVLASVLLWLFPMVVAHKLIPRSHYQNTIAVSAQEVVHVACIIFALWLFIVKLLPAITYYIPLAIYISRNHQSTLDYDQFHFLKIAPLVIQFIVAIILTFKSRAISKYLLDLGRESRD